MDEAELTTFQVEVAHTFFRLNASAGYVVAGGAALIASELIRRPTQDLDLFTSAPVVSVIAAKESFLKALSRRRWTATVIHDTATFCRLVVTDRKDESPGGSRRRLAAALASDDDLAWSDTGSLGTGWAQVARAVRSGRGARLRRRIYPCPALRRGCAPYRRKSRGSWIRRAGPGSDDEDARPVFRRRDPGFS
jgi:hypothetical protein